MWLTILHLFWLPCSACYLDGALPTAFDMIFKYTKSDVQIWDALLSNANTGGENVHRGAIVGAVLGAWAGVERLPAQMIEGLHDANKLAKEIDDFVSIIMR